MSGLGPQCARQRTSSKRCSAAGRLQQHSVPVEIEELLLTAGEQAHVDGLCGIDTHSSPGSRLPLYRRHRFLSLRGDTAIAMASQHRRTLSQHRSGLDQLSDPARCRKTRDEYLSFPQRVLFEKLGTHSMVIETDPFAHSPRGLNQIRQHACTLLGRGQSAGLWSFLLAQLRRAISSPARYVLHVGRRRADDADDSLARSRRGASRALSRRICRCRRLCKALALLIEAVPKAKNEAIHPPTEK
jgi:hypothetical protein